MFTRSVPILLLFVSDILVHCAYNDTGPSEEFMRKCCFYDIDVIGDDESRCDLETLNDTLTVISFDSFGNVSDTLCCLACSKRPFELEIDPRQPADQREYVSLDEKLNPASTCFKTCFSDGQTIRIWKDRKRNGTKDEEDGNHKSFGNKSEENDKESWHCDSVFSSLNFWGANMVVFANIVYTVPYVIVVSVYLAVLNKSTRAYHKAVFWYNVSQIVLNGILISIGTCFLCHVSIYSNVYSILGLLIMFLTISSTFWLLVICIDMTLVITRFRRTSPNDTSQEKKEKQKFVRYAACTWGASLLATIVAGIAELSPLLPISSPFRPNFPRFNDGANLAVIIYVATIPAVNCLANTILFSYTSYKMIVIQKSTKLATENLKINTMKTRYFVFLKLYLLMDAPWVSSALAAAFTDLWILKFLRMIQPILLLCAILPPGTVSRAFTSLLSVPKSKRIFKINQTP